MSLSRNSLTPGALVLGAGGNVGFGVVGALLEAGSPVLAVGREGPRMSALAEHFDDEPGLDLLHAPCIHDDRDAARLAEIIANHAHREGPLLPILHEVQAAKAQLAILTPAEIRAALEFRRCALRGAQ